jgi:ribonuclease VapC
MIVVDTSALVAILLAEPEAASMASALEEDEGPLMSAASYVELLLVMQKKKGNAGRELAERLVGAAGIRIAPVSEPQLPFAAQAIRRFGALNYGDLFSYALAKERDRPLLFKGDDFTKTDVAPVAV